MSVVEDKQLIRLRKSLGLTFPQELSFDNLAMVLAESDRMTTFDNMAKLPTDPADKSENGEFSGGFVLINNGGRPNPKPRPVQFLSNADPTSAQEALSASEGSNVYPARKHPLKPRKTKLACLGIPSAVLEGGSQEYARCVRLASAFKKARTREIFDAHGYVSSGVAALLAASALALSASRFLYEIAATTPIRPDAEDRGLSMPQVLKLASSLSDSARQNELSAWELAAREGVVRKRNQQNDVALPWLSPSVQPTGEVKRGPGRPRKVALLVEENPNA